MSALARPHTLAVLICALAVNAPSGLPFAGIAQAQEAVVAAPDAEALFTSTDPKLHANKQVVYRIIRELLEANHWDKADELLSERYLQHNPNVASAERLSSRSLRRC